MLTRIIALLLLLAPASFAGTFNHLDGVADSAGVVRGTKVSVFNAARSYARIQDTTLTISGKRILLGSLHDPAFNCVNATPRGDGSFDCGGSFEKFRGMEKSTSYYRASRGDSGNVHPAYFAKIITATTNADSVVTVDLLTGRIWMAFGTTAGSLIDQYYPLKDIVFLDGIDHIAGSGTVQRIDYLGDGRRANDDNGLLKANGNIQTRNSNLSQLRLPATPAIVNATVNSVSAIRDPFGKRDALGRLAQWWGVSTAARISWYNPYANSIYDETGSAITSNKNIFIPGGTFARLLTDGTQYYLGYKYSALSINADGASLFDELWYNGGVGSEDWAWGNAAVLGSIAAIPRASIAGTAAPLIAVAADSGLIFLHALANNNTNGGQQLIEGGFNSGYMKGAVSMMCPMEASVGSSLADISPNKNYLSLSGTHNYVNGVIGKADSLANAGAGSGYGRNHHGDTDFNYGTGSVSYAIWMKSLATSNPGAASYIMDGSAGAGGSADQVILYIAATSGYASFYTVESGAADEALSATDVWDGNWHFLVGVKTGISRIDLYIDGELAASDASMAGTGSLDPGSISIGGTTTGTVLFAGVVDAPYVGKGVVLTPTEIRTMYQQGLSGLQNNIDPNDALPNNLAAATDSVGYVQADQATGHFIAGNQDSVTEFNRWGIPIRKWGSPGGLIKDAALIPLGADSLGVAITTATKVGAYGRTQFIMPDVRVTDLAHHEYAFVQPSVGAVPTADSSGIAGLFWTGTDLFAAANNARYRKVRVLSGTYPGAVLSQDSMLVECADPWRTVFDGGITAIGLSVTGKKNTVNNCGERTTGGGGQTFNALNVTGAENTFIGNVVHGSDQDGVLATTGNRNVFDHLTVVAADRYAANASSGKRTSIINPLFSSAGSSIMTDSASDSLKVLGGHLIGSTGSVYIGAGADRATVVGVTLDGNIEDHATGTVTAGNQ